MLRTPLHFKRWIDEHRHLFKPPVGNKMVWEDADFIVMVVGSNTRKDFHVNDGEEFFYQVEGDIVLKVIEDGKPRDIPIRQGELFLLPAGVPHSPRRPANTVGLVVEQPKASQESQHLRWYCRRCNSLVYDAEFQPVDLGKQIKEMIEQFKASEELRTCKTCREVFAM